MYFISQLLGRQCCHLIAGKVGAGVYPSTLVNPTVQKHALRSIGASKLLLGVEVRVNVSECVCPAVNW